jgi:hypothetical protein
VLILIAAALLLSAGNSALPKPSQTPKTGGTPESKSAQVGNQNQGREQHQAESETGAAIQQGKPTPNQPPGGNADQEQKYSESVERFTGLLVLVGAFQFVALLVQAFVFYRALKESQRLSSLTAIAANAAKRSADVSERTLALAERPHLIAHTFKIDRFEERTANSLRVTYIVENYGKTPAFLTLWIVRFRLVELPIPVDYGPHKNLKMGWIVPPKEKRESLSILEGGPLTDESRRLVAEGKKQLVVYGRLEYLDILNKRHCFAFGCRYVLGRQGGYADGFEPIGQDEFWQYA